MMRCKVPVLGFFGWGGAIAETRLLDGLIAALAEQGIRVSVIKHAAPSFDIDKPGKDTYLIREAGAFQTLIGSSQRWALMTELAHAQPPLPEPDLAELLDHMDTSLVDMILVEGFRGAAIPKIEVHLQAQAEPLAAGSDPDIIAVVADADIDLQLPVLALTDGAALSSFVLAWLERQRATLDQNLL